MAKKRVKDAPVAELQQPQTLSSAPSVAVLPEPEPRPASFAEMMQGGRGLVCRKCGCRHFLVDHTRTAPGAIVRHRICRNCGQKRLTWER
jgi:DNA-directed RNA polymerase subunit RPC12/RpoP